MFTLHCDSCGWEVKRKKLLPEIVYYAFTHCKHLYCPRNVCKENHPRPKQDELNKSGLVLLSWGFDSWGCILTEEDADYVQKNGGRDYFWGKIVNPTFEDRVALWRGKRLLQSGLELQAEEESNRNPMLYEIRMGACKITFVVQDNRL